MAAATAHGSSLGPASSWPSNTAAPGPTHRKPMARRSDLSRPPCVNGPTQNTGQTPIKETSTYSHGSITTTGKDRMVASITARPSAAPTSEQPLDHLQAPSFAAVRAKGERMGHPPVRLANRPRGGEDRVN